MPSPTPFTLQGFLRFPPDDGAADADRSFSYQGTFTHKVEYDLILTGAGTVALDFGTLVADGAKAIQIEVAEADAGDTKAPVNFQHNGAGAPANIEVAQGGFLAYANPAPSAGILSLSVVHTQNAKVKVWILG